METSLGNSANPETASSVVSVLKSTEFELIKKTESNDVEGKKTTYVFKSDDIDLYLIQSNGESRILAVAPIGSKKNTK